MTDGSPDPIVSAVDRTTIDLPLPHGFIDISDALKSAHAAGMQGEMNHATLMVYRSKDGEPFAAWLISPRNALQAWLIGALDGKSYPPRD